MTARQLLPIRFLPRQPVRAAIVVGCVSLVASLAFALMPSFGREELSAPAEAKPPSSEYRRIFVPAENVETWPRDGEKFLPIESREFDAWVAAANAAPEEHASAVTISEAEYSARIENGQKLVGRGRWKIELRGEAPTFLPLRQMSLVIKDAHWRGSPQQPARLGVWGNSGQAASEFGLTVPESGTLEFAWEAQARPIHEGLEFAWQLPPATTTRILLDLPEGQQPRIDRGVVLATKRLARNAAAGERLRHWELGCNSSQHAALRIVAERPSAADDKSNTALHDELVYQVTPRGLDMETTWTLVQTAGNLPEELAVLIPRDLQLVSVTAEGAEMPWRAVDAEKDEQVRVVLRLPEKPSQRQLPITLRATYPLVLDKLWRLPKLRPQGVFWTSGGVTLVIANELEMRDLNPIGCVESNVSDLPGDANHQETWQVDEYSPAAEVEVEIARRQHEATLRLGSSLVMTDPDITGRLMIQWSVAQGKVHNLSGELARGWVIESVETDPADALGEWFIDQRNGRQYIDVQLTRAASAQRGVSVVINGRLSRSKYTDQLSANTLKMVKWRGAQVAQHLLAFETSEPFAVEPTGELPKFDVESIVDDVKTLIDPDTSPSTVFNLLQAGKTAGLKLTTKRARFAAEVLVDATLIGQELQQEYHVVITPTSNRVDRLLIAATHFLGDDVRWSEALSGATIAAERLPAEDSRRAGLPAGSELWLVQLPRPSAEPAEIAAKASLAWSRRSPLPLLAVPDALEQSGRVFLRAESDSSPFLEPRGMIATPIPAESADGDFDDLLRLRAAYRFDPADCLESTRVPRLWVTPSLEKDLSALIVRRMVLDSYFSSNGEASHRATLFLTNEGSSPFVWRLPSNAVLQTINVNGRAVTMPLATTLDASQSRQLMVPKGSSVVAISFDTRQRPLLIGSRLTPPFVAATPPLAGEWNIRLPEEFSLSSSGALNWRQRLFGPLGRPDGARAFQPLRPSDWVNILDSITSAWTGRGISSQPMAGWHTYRVSFVAGGPAAVQVSHPSATNAWAASIFLLSLVGGVWLVPRRNGVMIALLAVAGCLAFLLPAVWSPLAAGAVWGLLLSLVVPRPRPREDEIGASTHWHRFSTVGVSIVIAIGGLASLANGQQGGAANDGVSDPQLKSLHRILIPVDENGRQAGTKYYVSERFARELLRTASANKPADRRWLLRGVAYQGELRERAEPTGVVAGELTITCEVEVFTRDTTIVLPFVRDEAAWPASAMVDGVPLPIEWREGGGECAVRVAEPGRYSLVINAVPNTTVVQGHNVVTMSTLPMLGATLRLEHPPDLAGLNVSGATSRQTEPAPNVDEFALDGSGRLAFQWSSSDVALGTSNGRITQLEWLRLGEVGAELVAKYIFEGEASDSEGVVVAFDSAWELLQDEDSKFKGNVGTVSANRKTVRVQLPPNDTERKELVFRWRLGAAETLGRPRLPPIELVSHPVTQRWRAVSAATSIECDVDDDGASSGTPPEFLAMWGEDDESDSPQIVLGNVGADQPWNLSIKPRQSEPEIAEVLHVAADGDKVGLVYQATIVPGSVHQHRFPLMVPARLSIDEVVVAQSDRQIPLRWSRIGDDRVNVFFGQRLADDFQLTLSGTIPAADGDEMLPMVSVAGSDAAITVQLYRDDDVALGMRGLPADDESVDAPLESPPNSWMVRHVAGYRLDKAAAAKIRLQVQPNVVELVGDSATTLLRSADGWVASFQAEFTVTSGTLDALQLRVPPGWNSTPALDSSAPASISLTSRDEQGATLSIRFAESLPAGSAVELRVESPMAFPAASITVPQILPTPPLQGHRFLCVPFRLEGQPIAWISAGVRKAELPANLRSNSDVAAELQVFETTSEQFHLALQPRSGAPHTARVRLADMTVAFDPRGGQLMTTRFIVEPQGLSHCTLRLPDNQELVAIRLAGSPALAQRLNERDWRVTLGPPRLPSIVEVISRASKPTNAAGGTSEIRRPELLAQSEPIPVEMNLWSLANPDTSPRPAIGVTAEATVGEQAVLRFDRLLGIAESATAAAIESPTPDGYDWYRPWSALLTRLRNDAAETLATPDSRQVASRISRPVEEQLAAASARLEAWIEQCGKTISGPESDMEFPELWSSDLATGNDSPSERWVYCVTDGSLDRLVLDNASNNVSVRLSRAIGVLAIASLSGAAVLLMRRPAVLDLFYHWPHAVGFLIGTACWALLQPSWCGLLIAAACLARALRSGWPGRAIHLDASTVLRASRPK